MFLLLLFGAFVRAEEQLLTPRQLREDVDTAEGALREKHPALFRYTTERELARGFRELRTSLDTPMTALAFHRRLAPVVASLRCGHTRLIPAPHAGGTFFPLPVYFAGSTMYVDAAPGPERKLFEVVTFNGSPVRATIDRLNAQFALDGDAGEGKYRFLENFAPAYARGIDEAPVDFVLELRDGGRLAPMRVAAISRDALTAMQQRKALVFGTGSLVPIESAFDGETAVLTIRNFNEQRYRQRDLDFPTYVADFFRQANERKVKTLIIDLRHNGGGRDHYGALLFAHLTGKPFTYFRSVVKKAADGALVPVEHDLLQPQMPASPRFRGRTIVLVSGLTFSTAADFTAMFRHHRRGTILGEETGGGYDGNNSGESEEVVLPHSRLTLDIPLWRYENAVEPRGSRRGVLPDIEVRPTARDLERGIDRVMLAALRIARE
ncbi:MAG TPA: S41 family peptidase [Thermoanaerobaculia bacterium]